MSGRCVHALRSWQRLAPRIRGGRLLVLLDYDGTLVSIAPTPAHCFAASPGSGRPVWGS